MRAPTIWITGLPSSGKSTVAALVAERLRARDIRVEVLDGEDARRRLSPELGWTRADRLLHGQRLSEEAVRLNDAGIAVVVAAVSPYREGRVHARALIGAGFVEIYAACSADTCRRRDVKGLYARAAVGQLRGMTGVDDPYEAPLRPDLVLDTEHTTPEEAAASVMLHLDAVARTPPHSGPVALP